MDVAVRVEFWADRKVRDTLKSYPIGDNANWERIVANITAAR